MNEREIADVPRRFLAKVVSGNRITIGKRIVEAWNIQEGETYILELIRRVELENDE